MRCWQQASDGLAETLVEVADDYGLSITPREHTVAGPLGRVHGDYPKLELPAHGCAKRVGNGKQFGNVFRWTLTSVCLNLLKRCARQVMSYGVRGEERFKSLMASLTAGSSRLSDSSVEGHLI